LPLGDGTLYHSILVQVVPFPSDVYTDLNGQLSLPKSLALPPYILNFNGKRDKTYTGLVRVWLITSIT
jgi:hypothetical protein